MYWQRDDAPKAFVWHNQTSKGPRIVALLILASPARHLPTSPIGCPASVENLPRPLIGRTRRLGRTSFARLDRSGRAEVRSRHSILSLRCSPLRLQHPKSHHTSFGAQSPSLVMGTRSKLDNMQRVRKPAGKGKGAAAMRARLLEDFRTPHYHHLEGPPRAPRHIQAGS